MISMLTCSVTEQYAYEKLYQYPTMNVASSSEKAFMT